MRRNLKAALFSFVALALLAIAFGYGFLVNQKQLPPYRSTLRVYRALVPWYHRLVDLFVSVPGPQALGGRDVSPLSAEQEADIERLRAISYLAGTRPGSDLSGVTLHRPELASQGVNLVIDGHYPEALLIGMNGELLHRWSVEYAEAFPGVEVPADTRGVESWRRVKLFDNGDLLAIYEGQGLIKIDRDSRLLWSYPGLAHHDLEVADNGDIYVLTRRVEILPSINDRRRVLHDFITVLSSEGAEKRHLSIIEAIERSDYTSLLNRLPREDDLLHTNTLELLDGRWQERLPVFAAGNVLISILTLDTIAVIDMGTEKVVWSASGPWVAQHQPTLLDNGRLLLFDNRGADGWSRVLEVDALTQEITWTYDGREHGLRTAWCGSSQRLENGNTLITESDEGRAIEVLPDETIVWEYRTPHRIGADERFVATLYEVIRLGPEVPLDWLVGEGAG